MTNEHLPFFNHVCSEETCGNKPEETSTIGNIPKQTQEEPMEAKLNTLLDESKEVLTGVAVGTAYGCVISATVVACSTAKILFYPVYMANKAVEPFVDLVVAPVYPVLFGFLGGITGLVAKIAKDA